jgi:microcystin-dependent protein
MSDPFVGEIALFPFNFAPVNWALCNGQLLPISQNTALFSLLGTFYGGDGRSTFALPNLNTPGSAVCGFGQGPGLSDYVIGETLGGGTVTLLASEIPSHTHSLTLYKNASNVVAVPSAGAVMIDPTVNAFSAAAPNTTLSPGTLQTAGGSQAHNNMQPVLELSWCIALSGVFPSRA